MSKVELDVISSIVSSGDMTPFVSGGIRQELFTTFAPHYQFISAYQRRNGAPPTLDRLLEKFPDFIQRQVNAPPLDLLDKLREHAASGALTRVLGSLDRLASVAATTDALRRALLEVDAIQATSSVLNLGDVDDRSRLALFIRERANGGNRSVPWPWPTVQELAGNIDAADLITIAARPGVGKTWVLASMAASFWERGLRVLLVSNELTVTAMGCRMVALTTSVSYSQVRKGTVSLDFEGQLEQAMAGRPPFWIEGNDSEMGVGGVSAIRAMIARYQPDVVLIDGAYLLSDDRGAREGYNQAKNLVRDLKSCAKDTLTPHILAWQQNRGANDDPSQNSTKALAGTDAIGQDSSTVIVLGQSAVQRANGELEAAAVKMRDAPLWRIVLDVRPESATWKEFTPEPPGEVDHTQFEQDLDFGAATPLVTMEFT